jgi:hypothetical protein
MEIVSKEEAIIIGQKWYFTGIPCKNGHIDKRYTNTCVCYSCKRRMNRESRNQNIQTYKAIQRRSYKNNRENYLASSKRWTEENRERSNEIKMNWKKRHKDKYADYCSRYISKKYADPMKRLSKNMSKAIWECLKNGKEGGSWVDFVTFTPLQLRQHLETKFKEGMTWDNYGNYWHVDHVRPLSWFNLEVEFNKAWDLNNLQPLEASINYSKCNRYEG